MSRRDRRRNLLVISDLHLGEGLRSWDPGGGGESFAHLQRLERELSAFFIHYTAVRHEGRPWRLVINGDMVDFMSILMAPRPAAPLPSEVALSMRSGGEMLGAENVFGLAFGGSDSRRKLEWVIHHHEDVFRLLAKFISAGNDLVVVLGNHDMEFAHKEVQKTFVRRLVALGQDRRIGRRVRFCPWFYYEQDRIYIEHGHQYDEYCSFDYQLCPATATGGLALSFAHAGMRFFGNLVPSYDQRTAEKWGIFDYLRWGLSLGMRTMLWLTYLYGLLAWKASEIGTRLAHPQEEASRRARHRVQLLALSESFRIHEEKLLQLDGLRVVPAIRRLAKIVSVLFIDRVLLGLVTVPLLVLGLVLGTGLGKLTAVLSVLGVAVVLNFGLSRFRGVTSPTALRRVTKAIHRIVKAPLIVFGHSHEPERIVLAEGAVYYNTGTWMEGCGAHAGTHLVVLNGRPGTAPYAEMRRWQDGAATKLEL